jgi:hypothetical protein
MSKIPKKGPKRPNKRALVKKLDAVLSKYVRIKDADSEGFVTCYTCDSRKHWKEMQCGHFISRAYYSHRFNPDNVRPQCFSCNMYYHGRQYDFGKNLEREIGISTVEKMVESKSNPSGFTVMDYQDMIDHYTLLLETKYAG